MAPRRISHQFYDRGPLTGAQEVPVSGAYGGSTGIDSQDEIDRSFRVGDQLTMAEALQAGGSSTAPVSSVWEGLARVGQGALGGYLSRQAKQKIEDRENKAASDRAAMMGAFIKEHQTADIDVGHGGGPPGNRVYAPGPMVQGGYSAAISKGQELKYNPDTQEFLNQLIMGQFEQNQATEAAATLRAEKVADSQLEHERKIAREGLDKTEFERTLLAAGIKPGSLEWNNAWKDFIYNKTNPGPGVVVNTGKAPPGYRWNEDGTAYEIIPGSQAAREAEEAAAEIVEEKQAAQVAIESTAATQNVMENALDGAFAELDAAAADPFSLGASGTMSQIPALISDTYAGRLRSHILTLQSPIVMQGIEQLRASSASGATGFGAMNEKELDILLNMLGALNPDVTDSDIIRETLEGVRKQVEIVKSDVLKNVTPDRLRELGLGHWLPTTEEPTLDEILAEIARREALTVQPPQNGG